MKARTLVLSVVLLSCNEPNLVHERWEPLTQARVEAELTAPTGRLGDISEEDLQAIAEALPGVVEAAPFIGYVTDVLDRATAGAGGTGGAPGSEDLPPAREAPKEEDATWGTSLYVRLACPGDQVEPPFDFEQGELRLDSPELRGTDFGSLLTEGQFLMSFDECRLGPVTVDRRLPGRYLLRDSPAVDALGDPTQAPRVIAALDLQSDADGTLGVVAFGCGGGTRSCSSAVSVAASVHLPGDSSYVVSFRGTRDFWLSYSGPVTTAVGFDVTIAASDGSLSCDGGYSRITGSTLNCPEL